MNTSDSTKKQSPTDSRLYLGVDLGGTSITVGLVDEAGKVLDWINFPTLAERGHQPIIQEIAQRAKELCRKEAGHYEMVAGVGVGSPGPLDLKTGTVIFTPNLKWKNVPLRDMLSALLDKPVVVDGDAVAATYGEWWAGAGQPYRDMVGITLGTGVGGGIVLDGRVHHGFLGVGGHLGHMIIVTNGRPCTCGANGCLEAYASATAIVDRSREALCRHPASILRRSEGGLTSKMIFEAAQRGDQFAQRIFDETGFFLAVGINNLLNILNPEAVIILGSVAKAGDTLFRPLKTHLKSIAFPHVFEETRILRGTLDQFSGVIGAAGLAARARLA